MAGAPIETIQQLAHEIATAEGVELIDIEFKPGKSRNLLRVYIDKTGGVTLADCENISRQLGTVLDVKDLLQGAYVLEVSSPGIGRPFKTDRDYERALGRTVKAQITTAAGIIQQVIGTLVETNDETILIENEGHVQSINRENVKRIQEEIVLPSKPKKNRKKRK